MIHLLWFIPAYPLIGIIIARACMKIAAVEVENAAVIALAWPLFIPLCITYGLYEGCRRVLVKMEERNHDDR